MIKTFADRRTHDLYFSGRSRRLPPGLARRALRKLAQLNAASTLQDLRVPPSNRLHALPGDREGQHSIWVNGQWRICFRFEDSDAYEGEVCDYHD